MFNVVVSPLYQQDTKNKVCSVVYCVPFCVCVLIANVMLMGISCQVFHLKLIYLQENLPIFPFLHIVQFFWIQRKVSISCRCPKGFSFTFSVIFFRREEQDVQYLWGYSRPWEMKGLSLWKRLKMDLWSIFDNVLASNGQNVCKTLLHDILSFYFILHPSFLGVVQKGFCSILSSSRLLKSSSFPFSRSR